MALVHAISWLHRRLVYIVADYIEVPQYMVDGKPKVGLLRPGTMQKTGGVKSHLVTYIAQATPV